MRVEALLAARAPAAGGLLPALAVAGRAGARGRGMIILEGFGMVLLEAMAAAIPVIATNFNGIKEVVIDGKCGILVPPRNPEAIANAVSRIINDPQLSKDLVREGFERARLFDIQEHILKLDNLYNSLLGVESYQ